MKVAFDYQIFSLQRYGGISRYFARIAEEMNSEAMQSRIFAGFHINGYLKNRNSFVSGSFLEKYPKRTIRAFRKWNEWQTTVQSFGYNPDLIHETYFSSKPAIRSRVPVVLTIYDMIQELYPELFDTSQIHTRTKIESLLRADHILSISHQTKRDLCNLFEISPDKVSVVHLAADPPLKSDHANDTISKGKPYFLFVGLRAAYKNFRAFAETFAASPLLVKEMNIVTFGGGNFSKNEMDFFQSLGLTENQILHIEGDDQVLANYYSQAQAFVYPSLYEGFGIPPLEAMAYDCPVISSNTSSMPEVLGDAALYFSPFALDELKQ